MGGCAGVDTVAGQIAQEMKFDISVEPAEWTKYGRAAGPIRNEKMVLRALEYQKQGIPTVVLAFHDAIEKSRGTKNCVARAKKAGLPVFVYRSVE